MTKNIVSPVDINGRVLANFVYDITHITLNVWITKGNRRINAKSILGLLSLDVKNGDEITITTNTENESDIDFIVSKIRC